MSTRTSKQAVFLPQRKPLEINWHLLRRVAWILLGSLVFVWMVMELQRSDFLPIKKIQALGNFEHVNERVLQGVVASAVKGGYFTVNVGDVQTAIEKLPWVAQASVSRIWPDTLEINLLEQQVNAKWAKGGLVNQEGVVFFPKPETYPTGLPVFDGPVGMERNMTEFYLLAREILEPLGIEIVRLNMDSRRAVSLELNNGIEIILGREDTHKRLERFARVYKKVLLQRIAEIEKVDMRYSNGLSVGWRKHKVKG